MRYPKLAIQHDHLTRIASFERFCGEWEVEARSVGQLMKDIRDGALAEGIGASLRLEGEFIDDSQVGEVLQQPLTDSPPASKLPARLTSQVKGLRAVYSELTGGTPRSGAASLEPASMKWLHSMALEPCADVREIRGVFRRGAMSVRAFDNSGALLGDIFEAAPAEDIESLLTAIAEGYREDVEEGVVHPLLLVSWVVLQLMCAQPFRVGSTRVTMAVMRGLLLHHGFQAAAYGSIEAALEREAGPLYVALRNGRRALGESAEIDGLAAWHSFFLTSIASVGDTLGNVLRLDELLGRLPPLSEDLVKLVRQRGRLTLREAQTATGANRNTVKAHLRKLVDRTILVRMGVGKGSWYRLPTGADNSLSTDAPETSTTTPEELEGRSEMAS